MGWEVPITINDVRLVLGLERMVRMAILMHLSLTNKLVSPLMFPPPMEKRRRVSCGQHPDEPSHSMDV